tara:strand:- start:58 stop:288 length:231 start_codon:yes stop_codon:yes gene_type:complete
MTVLEVEPLVGEDGEVREITMDDLKFARRGRPALPEETRKKRVSIMLDPEIIERLKSEGKGWQTRANALLRKALAL